MSEINKELQKIIVINGQGGVGKDTFIDILSEKGLKITNVTSDELSSCIIYPYYYAATLYQPTLKSTESAIYN